MARPRKRVSRYTASGNNTSHRVPARRVPLRRVAPPRAPRHVVVLGGAGAMGRITVRDLLRTAARDVEVVAVDRDVAPLRGTSVCTMVADISDPASLRRALAGAFVVIASLPYRFNLAAMHGTLNAGAHYIDLGGLFHVTRQQMRLSRAFAAAGRMAILGMGSAPGILNVLAVRAAHGLDRVREIHCMVGASDRTRYRNPSPLGFGYSPDTLLDEFTMESAVFRNGAFRMVPPLDPRERIDVRFPAPVGAVELDTTLHSEVATLPLSFADRGVQHVTFRQSFEPEYRDRLAFLVRLGLAGTQAIEVAGGAPPGGGRSRSASRARGVAGRGARARQRVVPRDVLGALLSAFPAPAPVGKPDRYEVLRVVVAGTRGGRHVTVTADCHAGPRAGWGIGPDIDTGAPPSIAAQLLASGEMPVRPGVWAPEQVVPVRPFLRELERRGMRVVVRRSPGRGAR